MEDLTGKRPELPEKPKPADLSSKLDALFAEPSFDDDDLPPPI